MQFKIEQGIKSAKSDKFKALRKAYNLVVQGIDPDNSKPTYIDCNVNNVTYRMNAGQQAATVFDQGIHIAEMNGEDTVFVVDFYDDIHLDIPIVDAKIINLQQANGARVNYREKQALKRYILEAKTVSELRELTIKFTVNSKD